MLVVIFLSCPIPQYLWWCYLCITNMFMMRSFCNYLVTQINHRYFFKYCSHGTEHSPHLMCFDMGSVPIRNWIPTLPICFFSLFYRSAWHSMLFYGLYFTGFAEAERAFYPIEMSERGPEFGRGCGGFSCTGVCRKGKSSSTGYHCWQGCLSSTCSHPSEFPWSPLVMLLL